ncbi:MAG TPA: glycine--tRNA ligase subunit beta [Desulfurivibrio alkaliphilus]|uniref:Glycine--tRNA ligase beta subunit n=1 Tax=Desulfurivibrio alkaliphilus TaxID=427923 RepID=A0A7C2XUV1_9BACT|nr:glycine--tRNA ligase subunit beta [Desulfurivibrio alkaliphilus]
MSEQELLFEIGSEEIPAGYITPALTALREGLARGLSERNLTFGEIRSAATPRRLTVSVANLARRQPDRVEEVLGPPKKAAYDAQGQPTKAATGFAAGRGIGVEQLQIKKTPKGEYLMAVIERPGRDTPALLAELLPELVLSLPFPKSMHWGTGRTLFARPLRWLLAVYDHTPLTFNLDDLRAGEQTWGHRFMAPQPLTATSFSQYLESLRQARVLADPEERRQAVLAEIEQAAAAHGGRILPDPELVETVVNLVESPFAICGSFAERFLALPHEVLITSMREHQKYFAVTDQKGKLLPRFVAVNNTRVRDAKLAARGHQRVLRARLEDALFFFNEDQQRPLAQLARQLHGIIFQAKLGTLAEKSARVAELAAELAQQFAPDQAETVARAAILCKADLLTGMVGEFPSLQGAIGRDYARRQGEPAAVAEAIYSHYLPMRAGDRLPADPAGAILGIADRLDTLAGCFGIGLKVTGAADPFGLRRQAVGLIHLIQGHKIALPLLPWLSRALALYGDRLSEQPEEAAARLLEFIRGRFANDLTGRGLPGEAVEAVLSVDFHELNDCRARIEALVAVGTQPAFPLLAAAFKRVNNIIKDNRDHAIDPELLSEEAERELARALDRAEAEAAPLLAAGNYHQALLVILRMKEPVDRFFDQVMVMAEEPPLRRNRLALLTAVARLFLRVGDFSKMYALREQS